MFGSTSPGILGICTRQSMMGNACLVDTGFHRQARHTIRGKSHLNIHFVIGFILKALFFFFFLARQRLDLVMEKRLLTNILLTNRTVANWCYFY